jgi:hypothetical protein
VLGNAKESTVILFLEESKFGRMGGWEELACPFTGDLSGAELSRVKG